MCTRAGRDSVHTYDVKSTIYNLRARASRRHGGHAPSLPKPSRVPIPHLARVLSQPLVPRWIHPPVHPSHARRLSLSRALLRPSRQREDATTPATTKRRRHHHRERLRVRPTRDARRASKRHRRRSRPRRLERPRAPSPSQSRATRQRVSRARTAARNLFPHAFAVTPDDDASGCERIATRLNARFTSSTLGRERAGKPNVSRWAPMSSSPSSSSSSFARLLVAHVQDSTTNARARENRRSTLDARRSTLDGRRSMTEDERLRAENTHTHTHTHTRGAPTHPAHCRDESRSMPWTHPPWMYIMHACRIVFNI